MREREDKKDEYYKPEKHVADLMILVNAGAKNICMILLNTVLTCIISRF